MSSNNGKYSIEETKDWHPVFRELIMHENELLNQRITWLIQSQGLFFTALAFAWGTKSTLLVGILAFLGISTALSMGSVITMTSPTIDGLRKIWEKYKPEDLRIPPVIGDSGSAKGLRKYLKPWRALPVIFIIAWLLVAIYSFTNVIPMVK